MDSNKDILNRAIGRPAMMAFMILVGTYLTTGLVGSEMCIRDSTYTAGDTFIVGPKTPKHTMGNAKTDNAIVWFAAIGAKDVPILIPAEG